MKNINIEDHNIIKIIPPEIKQSRKCTLKKEMTCITCPIGCSLNVVYTNDKEMLNVTGATCKRGKTYAYNEITNPKRVITSTIMVTETNSVTSVKTDAPIPKDKILECMKHINNSSVSKEARIGDIVIPNICGTDANIILTRDAT